MTLSRRKGFMVFLVGIMGVMASPCTVFGGTKYERESLKAMSGVRVSVSNSDKTLATHGITVAMLKKNVELKLRVAKIKVYDDPSDPVWGRTGRPEIHVNVIGGELDPVAAYGIEVLLLQDAVLKRGNQPVRATTWRSADVTYGVVGYAHAGIRKMLGEAIDNFINDYLAVNQR
ncbi:MAG TPA: hypothetical protein VIV15_12105 [Anaerolineales bacterium]